MESAVYVLCVAKDLDTIDLSVYKDERAVYCAGVVVVSQALRQLIAGLSSGRSQIEQQWNEQNNLANMLVHTYPEEIMRQYFNASVAFYKTNGGHTSITVKQKTIR